MNIKELIDVLFTTKGDIGTSQSYQSRSSIHVKLPYLYPLHQVQTIWY